MSLVYLIIGGLGFGVLRKNRVCAIALLAYFVLDKVLVIMSDPSGFSSSIASIVIWGNAYFNGILGTFNWHKLMKEPQAQEAQEQEQLTQSIN